MSNALAKERTEREERANFKKRVEDLAYRYLWRIGLRLWRLW